MPEPQNFIRERAKAAGMLNQHRDRDDEHRHDGRVEEEGLERSRRQKLDEVAKRRVIDPPRVRGGGDLARLLQARDQHVQRRQEREAGEDAEEEIGPAHRPFAVAADRAGVGVGSGRDAGGGGGERARRHHIFSPRLLMSRRMKIAATVRIGTMNSEIDAPSGMSPPSMPSLNAQVANMWVRSMGPPAVRMRTMSKFAKVTMSENSVVMAMMFRIIGRVTYQSFWSQLAPSIAATS